MRCRLCRKRRLPIGTCVTERACEQTCGSRFKLVEHRWPKATAKALPAAKRRFMNNRRLDLLERRACRVQLPDQES